MAERKTYARPYAEAVFELAQESATLPSWSEFMDFYRIALRDPALIYALRQPRLTAAQKVELLSGLRAENSGQQNALIGLLLENRKLELMPEIAALFEQMRADAEGSLTAQVTSAFELDPQQVEALAAALKRKFSREVVIETSVDSSIIGGVVIRAGDKVIDGSVAGRLRDLTSNLTR